MQITHPTEMFKGNVYRVVHCSEEAVKALKDGWGPDRDPETNYVPITAVAPMSAPGNAGSGANIRAALAAKGDALKAESDRKAVEKLAKPQ